MRESGGGERNQQMGKLGRRLVLFPVPFQGHAAPMLQLATLLHSKGFSITIIQTRYNSLHPSDFPHFTFHSIDDGLSGKPPYFSLLADLNTRCREPFRGFLSQILSEQHDAGGETVGCLITDSLWRFTRAIAESFGLPRIVLRTASVSSFVVYDSLRLLHQKGYFPIQEHRLDETVVELPFLRIKDLPRELQMRELLDAIAQETKASQGIIFNSFEELESDPLGKLRLGLSTPIFTVGPLHQHMPLEPSAGGNKWAHDRSPSLSWLDSHAPKSVLYVSFGSVAAVGPAELLEIAWGLANSEQPFLWVVRDGLILGSGESDPFPDGYMEAIGERGKIVEWAPQREVLAHRAVRGFWTHGGWNSTLESVREGVPMVCTPFLFDQPINERLMSERWKVGVLLDKGAKRGEIERMVRRLMVEEEGKEMRERVAALKEKAALCLMEGGSTYESLEGLISYILSLK